MIYSGADDDESGLIYQVTLAGYQEPKVWEPMLFELGFKEICTFNNDNTSNDVTLYHYYSGGKDMIKYKG